LKTSEKDLEQLEAEINPVLDDNAVVALCYLLGKSVEVMKAVEQVISLHAYMYSLVGIYMYIIHVRTCMYIDLCCPC